MLVYGVLSAVFILAAIVSMIIFVVRWITKKEKKQLGFFVIFCVVIAMLCEGASIARMTPGTIETPTPIVTATPTIEPTHKLTPIPTATPTPTPEPVSMKKQFVRLGLTETEAEEMQKVFENIGITQISDISKTLGSGIDGEQRYVCRFYDFNPNVDCIKVSFTIVKRKVQRISICFSPYEKLDEFPASHKYKELALLDGIKEDTHSDSVTLYYQKLQNMAVDENSTGYIAVYDYKTHSVSKYK